MLEVPYMVWPYLAIVKPNGATFTFSQAGNINGQPHGSAACLTPDLELLGCFLTGRHHRSCFSGGLNEVEEDQLWQGLRCNMLAIRGLNLYAKCSSALPT